MKKYETNPLDGVIYFEDRLVRWVTLIALSTVLTTAAILGTLGCVRVVMWYENTFLPPVDCKTPAPP